MEATLVRDLMEAYSSIYYQRNQTDLEVEYVVNSLLDEGYDLSDYTWEDMYAVHDYLQSEGYSFEVENWVNSLLNEGYDLSDYTWDDMYQIYFSEQNLYEKLKPGTRGRISFATGRDSRHNQAMTETNPRTGRQRKTSPEMKAMGAHARARNAQERATQSGDHEAAARHRKRRGDIAHVVYNRTGRLLDYRADND